MALMLPIYDYRPSGVHNTHRMCEAQLGQSGFDVVRHVHDNMRWLYDLYSKMGTLAENSNAAASLSVIQPYLGEIEMVSKSLNDILTLNKSLPLVADLAPRIQAFTSQLEEFNDKASINKEEIDCLISEGKSILSKTEHLQQKLSGLFDAEVAKGIATIQQAVYDQKVDKKLEEMSEIEQRIEERLLLVQNIIERNEDSINLLVHLQASDAVLTYVYVKSEQALEIAKKAIQESESYGNDESVNRKRLSEVVPVIPKKPAGGCKV